MYAITFNLDTKTLKELEYSPSKAYEEVRKFLKEHNFTHEDDTFYLGNKKIDSSDRVTEVLEKILNKFNWFCVCVKKIKKLKIEEYEDLMPVVKKHLKTIL